MLKTESFDGNKFYMKKEIADGNKEKKSVTQFPST